MSLKILHFADVHLGRGFSDYAEASDALSEARYETLDQLTKTANEKSCDTVVVSGNERNYG